MSEQSKSSEIDKLKAEQLYLQGKQLRREGKWEEAAACYMEAMELDMNSPAATAYSMEREIIEFRNKDMFNH